jgi:hypothetical protein
VPLVVAIVGLIGTVGGTIVGVVITSAGRMPVTRRRGSVSANDGLVRMREAYIEFCAAVHS